MRRSHRLRVIISNAINKPARGIMPESGLCVAFRITEYSVWVTVRVLGTADRSVVWGISYVSLDSEMFVEYIPDGTILVREVVDGTGPPGDESCCPVSKA